MWSSCAALHCRADYHRPLMIDLPADSTAKAQIKGMATSECCFLAIQIYIFQYNPLETEVRKIQTEVDVSHGAFLQIQLLE